MNNEQIQHVFLALSYTVNEKLKIVREAEENGNRAIARKYDVSESCIHDWRKMKTVLSESSSSCRPFCSQKVKF